jgi:DNA mismatch repair protein MutS2
MKLRVGQRVRVKNLNTIGNITDISSYSKNNKENKITVSIGSMQIVCLNSDLDPLPPPSSKSRKMSYRTKSNLSLKVKAKKVHEIDLHGYKTHTVAEALENTINRCVLEQVEVLKVIHGLGRGLLKEVVLKYLQTCQVVRHHQVDLKNPGVTFVYFNLQ